MAWVAGARLVTPALAVGRPARSPLGVSAKVWRTVSLHWRTLAKPAAKATWAMGSSVVSSRTRAVWLRWARARASGPVPTSAVRTRLSWRSL